MRCFIIMFGSGIGNNTAKIVDEFWKIDKVWVRGMVDHGAWAKDWTQYYAEDLLGYEEEIKKENEGQDLALIARWFDHMATWKDFDPEKAAASKEANQKAATDSAAKGVSVSVGGVDFQIGLGGGDAKAK